MRFRFIERLKSITNLALPGLLDTRLSLHMRIFSCSLIGYRVGNFFSGIHGLRVASHHQMRMHSKNV